MLSLGFHLQRYEGHSEQLQLRSRRWKKLLVVWSKAGISLRDSLAT